MTTNDKYELLFKRYSGLISKHHANELDRISSKTKIPISRLIAIAVDNEFSKEKPFAFDVTLPTEEVEEYAYIDQAGMILNFLKKLKHGLPLELLVLLRHDIGIADKETFMNAWKDLVTKGFVESFTKTKKRFNKGIEYETNWRIKS